jgi:hypothetical protein
MASRSDEADERRCLILLEELRTNKRVREEGLSLPLNPESMRGIPFVGSKTWHIVCDTCCSTSVMCFSRLPISIIPS